MKETITGVILAGGLGRRMGGVDKGLQLLQGRPMVQWVLERLTPQVGTVLINANRNLEHYRAFGCPVLPDTIADFAGPLAGLHAALGAATTPLVVSVPCDSPYLPNDLVARLAAGLHAAGAELAVARDAERAHPVFCLARRELLPRLAAYLASGERRLARWHETLSTVEVMFEEPAAFANFNTLDDLGAGRGGDVTESQ